MSALTFWCAICHALLAIPIIHSTADPCCLNWQWSTFRLQQVSNISIKYIYIYIIRHKDYLCIITCPPGQSSYIPSIVAIWNLAGLKVYTTIRHCDSWVMSITSFLGRLGVNPFWCTTLQIYSRTTIPSDVYYSMIRVCAILAWLRTHKSISVLLKIAPSYMIFNIH